MRFKFKQGKNEQLQEDLNMVQDVLNSGYFIFIDIFFWAFLLTLFTTPALHSLRAFLIYYICYFITGIGLFLLIRRLFKPGKQSQSDNTEERDRLYSFINGKKK